MHDTIANRYTIVDRIGSGGVSTVYRAVDTAQNREVAVKILHKHLSRRSSVLRQLESEIEITRKIHHPGIASYHELIRHGDETILVLEYLPGGDLKRRIRMTGAIPPLEAVRLSIEVLEALGAAHEQGIVHRDIKPHNILLDREGHIRITDFGLARTGATTPADDAARAGTPDYVAPEVSQGGYADARSDLYSFGVTLYEMLTGKLPYRSNNPYETIWKHANADIPSVRADDASIPEYLDVIMNKALEKEPSQRFQTAAAFADALRSASPPLPAPKPASHPCPFCGEEILEAFPYCLRCDRAEAYVAMPAPGEVGCGVVVTGPGKPGDRLDPGLRHEIVAFLKSIDVPTRPVEKRIPRVPFILVGRLSEASALQIARGLERFGLDVTIAGADRTVKRAVTRVLNKKTLALYPRVLMIGFGSMAGVWTSLGRQAPAALGVIIPVLFTMLLIGMRLSYRTPLIRNTGERRMFKTARLVEDVGKIREPEMRKLIRSIAGRLDILTDQSRERGAQTGIDEHFDEVVVAILDDLSKHISIISDLEQAKESIPYDDEASTSVRRNIESTIQQYTERMLRFSVSVDKLCLDLAGIHAARADDLSRKLVELGDELAVGTEAAGEILSIPGGAS